MNIVNGLGMPERDAVIRNIDKLKSKFNYLPKGMKLKSTDDFGKLDFSLPTHCKLEQLAVYNDETNRIDIDTEIWNSLNEQNKAALIAHEVIYKHYRDAHDKDSKLTRKIVAMLFSTTPPKNQLSDSLKITLLRVMGITQRIKFVLIHIQTLLVSVQVITFSSIQIKMTPLRL
jgi:hypothetical protein